MSMQGCSTIRLEQLSGVRLLFFFRTLWQQLYINWVRMCFESVCLGTLLQVIGTTPNNTHPGFSDIQCAHILNEVTWCHFHYTETTLHVIEIPKSVLFLLWDGARTSATAIHLHVDIFPSVCFLKMMQWSLHTMTSWPLLCHAWIACLILENYMNGLTKAMCSWCPAFKVTWSGWTWCMAYMTTEQTVFAHGVVAWKHMKMFAWRLVTSARTLYI